MKTCYLFIILLCISLLSNAQTKRTGKTKKENLQTTSSGLLYKILYDSLSENVKTQDLILLKVKYNNGIDSLNCFQSGRPVSFLADNSIKGGLEEGMFLLSKGDSALFVIDNETLYKKTFRLDSLPPGITQGSKTTFIVKIIDVMSSERVKQEKIKRLKKQTEDALYYMSIVKKDILDSSTVQIKTDDNLIQNYIKTNKLNAQKTPSGIYYVITKEGSGPICNPGDSASVYYTGKLLNGKEFDKSQPGMPLLFQTGVGNVIPGFDEPLNYIKEGSKATLIIPSPFAYSTQGVKNLTEEELEYIIPPNSVLIFDIEVLKYSSLK